MRLIALLLGCGLSASVSASEEAPPDSTPNDLENSNETPLTTKGSSASTGADSSYWEVDYKRGMKTARVGTRLGTVGVFSAVAGLSTFAVALSINDGSLDWESGAVVPLVGMGFAGLGFLAIQAGAPVAAIGTAQSHRALVSGDQAQPGCGNCVAAVVLSVPTPLTVFALPASYVLSSMQRRTDAAVYHRHKGWPPPPRVGVSPQGVEVSGQF